MESDLTFEEMLDLRVGQAISFGPRDGSTPRLDLTVTAIEPHGTPPQSLLIRASNNQARGQRVEIQAWGSAAAYADITVEFQ